MFRGVAPSGSPWLRCCRWFAFILMLDRAVWRAGALRSWSKGTLQVRAPLIVLFDLCPHWLAEFISQPHNEQELEATK